MLYIRSRLHFKLKQYSTGSSPTTWQAVLFQRRSSLYYGSNWGDILLEVAQLPGKLCYTSGLDYTSSWSSILLEVAQLPSKPCYTSGLDYTSSWSSIVLEVVQPPGKVCYTSGLDYTSSWSSIVLEVVQPPKKAVHPVLSTGLFETMQYHTEGVYDLIIFSRTIRPVSRLKLKVKQHSNRTLDRNTNKVSPG